MGKRPNGEASIRAAIAGGQQARSCILAAPTIGRIGWPCFSTSTVGRASRPAEGMLDPGLAARLEFWPSPAAVVGLARREAQPPFDRQRHVVIPNVGTLRPSIEKS